MRAVFKITFLSWAIAFALGASHAQASSGQCNSTLAANEVTDSPLDIGRPLSKDKKFLEFGSVSSYELKHYQGFTPEGAKLIRPPVRKYDLDLYRQSERHGAEALLVEVYFENGEFLYLTDFMDRGRFSITISSLALNLASALKTAMQVERFDEIKRVVVAHTHPGLSAQRRGLKALPSEFSDADLEGARLIKHYFQANGFDFELSFEIIYSMAEDNPDWDYLAAVAKKGIWFPKNLEYDSSLKDLTRLISAFEKRAAKFSPEEILEKIIKMPEAID